jgi:hypothetical protein
VACFHQELPGCKKITFFSLCGSVRGHKQALPALLVDTESKRARIVFRSLSLLALLSPGRAAAWL